MARENICCICGKELITWGNDPWPVKDKGLCCDDCNMNVVIPARIRRIRRIDEDVHLKA